MINKDDSYEEAYKKLLREKPHLFELLEEGYEAISKKIKIFTLKHEWVPFMHSCTVMDKVVMTIIYLYEKQLSELRKELDDYKCRFKSSGNIIKEG